MDKYILSFDYKHAAQQKSEIVYSPRSTSIKKYCTNGLHKAFLLPPAEIFFIECTWMRRSAGGTLPPLPSPRPPPPGPLGGGERRRRRNPPWKRRETRRPTGPGLDKNEKKS